MTEKNSNNIQLFSERDKVRRKISIWLGSSNHNAVLHCIKELIGNTSDEIGKGFGDKIELILHDDKTITVRDNCLGIPMEGTNENGTENYELLLEYLFAGTKYDNGIENNDYTVGTNGLFLAILTYSSEKVEYKIARPDGNIYEVSYRKGILEEPFRITGVSDSTFSEIRFTLDDDIFEENYYDFDEVCTIANELASLLKDGSIEVSDERRDIAERFYYKNGIVEFLEEKTKKLNSISEMAVFSREISHHLEKENLTDDVKIEMAFKYTREDEGKTAIEFLNGSNLIHHGTIYDGLVSGFRNSINKFIKDNKMYKKNEKQISKDDIMIGLNYVVNFKSYFPIYANQTKFSSEVKYYKDAMQNVIQDYFDVYSLENKRDMERIANQILNEKRAMESAERIRMNVKDRLKKSSNVFEKVDKLIECRSENPKDREIYIAEGDSSKDSLLQGRDKLNQSIFPIKGKVLSCLKASPNQIFGSEVITNIYKILGCGVELKDKKNKSFTKFSLDDLQYNKIIIASDFDDDGHQITVLLLTMFYILTPTLVEKGYIYRAESPLFEIYDDEMDRLYYAYSEDDRDRIIKENNLIKYEVSRNKGIGELQAETVSETMMNPDTRRLIQFTVEDVEKAVEALELFMGEDVLPRRKYIEEHFDEYEFVI